MDQLSQIFPDMPREELQRILVECDNDAERAVDLVLRRQQELQDTRLAESMVQAAVESSASDYSDTSIDETLKNAAQSIKNTAAMVGQKVSKFLATDKQPEARQAHSMKDYDFSIDALLSVDPDAEEY